MTVNSFYTFCKHDH